MKPVPSNPMLAHQRMIDAFCDDLWDMCMNGGEGTPRTDAVAEIMRQTREANEGDCRSGTVATQASPRAGSRLGHPVSVNYRKQSLREREVGQQSPGE